MSSEWSRNGSRTRPALDQGHRKQQGIRLAISMLDLTTLEGADTAGKVRQLCAKAVCPASTMPEVQSVAAVWIYPSLVAVARDALGGTGVRTASVATGFPAGQVSLEAKLRDTEDAVAAGADEIDMVISRAAFLAGDDALVMEEMIRVKDACGDVIEGDLEAAELGSYDHVRHASMLAMEAGADFIKTATGKASSGATPGVCLVMLRRSATTLTALDGPSASRPPAASRPARPPSTAWRWSRDARRPMAESRANTIGASSLLNDLLMQYSKVETGRYGRSEDFSKE